METKLRTYFPMIRERKELLEEIQSKEVCLEQFQNWTSDQQEEFLAFCTGAKGVKILYDAFFKEIMNPESAPELLEEFLSLVIGKEIRIFCVLPNDSTRIADENSLLITDIVVQLRDGSLANVEVQKIGYLFPGERSACYSADLLLRQYKRVRGEKKKKFSYKDIKSVYTIVLFEKSPNAFWQFPNTYLHYFSQSSDSGLKLELLQKYVFIPLDIFQRKTHNKVVKGRLEAWLMFFSTDDPEDMIQLIQVYPEFSTLYEQMYQMCRNVEKIMGIFSEELLLMDRNTVQYMMDEMQDTIDQQAELIAKQRHELEEERERQRRELEEERERQRRQLVRQVRNMAEKGISAKECRDMLAADEKAVEIIYKMIQECPKMEDADICKRLE